MITDIIVPYDYQEQGISDINESWKTCNSVMYQLPTGGGKTVIFTEIVRRNPDKRFLIMVHRQEVVYQIVERLKSIGIDPGIIMSKEAPHPEKSVQVASVQTISRDKRLKEYIQYQFDYFIVDEAHHADAKSYRKTLDAHVGTNSDMKILGVTATPTRMGKSNKLHEVFDTMIVSKSIRWLIDNGYLADFIAYSTPVPDLDKVKLQGGDYQIRSLSQYMQQRSMIKNIVHSYRQMADHKKNIVFCVDTNHARVVRDEFRKEGYTSEMILGDTSQDDRIQIMNDFRSNKIEVLTCVMVLTEGVDVPDTQVIQLARPTKSLVMYMQAVGRGLRKKPDGSKLTIIDNAGCIKEHMLIDFPKNWSLDPTVNPNKIKDTVIVGRKLNGVIVEDEEEMELLPIEQLTPEQYMKELNEIRAHGNKTNLGLKNQRFGSIKDIAQFLIRKTNLPDWVDYEIKDKINSSEIEFFNTSEKEHTFTRCLMTLQFKSDGSMDFEAKTNWHSKEMNLKLLSMAGKVADVLQDSSELIHIESSLHNILNTRSKQINLDEIDSNINSFKRKVQERLITEWLQGKEEIVFPKLVRADWKYSYYKINRFNKLTFDKPVSGSGSKHVTFENTSVNPNRFTINTHTIKSCKFNRIINFVIESEIDYNSANYSFL